ncbi:Hypothetical predicted protein, partial [Mytilus galloprovincialis]
KKKGYQSDVKQVIKGTHIDQDTSPGSKEPVSLTLEPVISIYNTLEEDFFIFLAMAAILPSQAPDLEQTH